MSDIGNMMGRYLAGVMLALDGRTVVKPKDGLFCQISRH